MAVSRQKRLGFSLVELLVVVVIIALLLGILLPAVSNVREASRRATCKGNLKQVGIAAQQHLEKYGFFPSGGWGYQWIGDPDRGVGKQQPGGWIYSLLPFWGLDSVHDLAAGISALSSGSLKSQALGQMKNVTVPFMICPSRRRAIGYPGYTGGGVRSSMLITNSLDEPPTVGRSDYAASAGTCSAYAAYTGYIAGPSSPSACYNTTCTTAFITLTGGTATGAQPYGGTYKVWNGGTVLTYPSNFDGIVTQGSQVRPTDIIDGLTNTIFVGEKYVNPSHYYDCTDTGDNSSLFAGAGADTLRFGYNVYTGGNDPVVFVTPRRDTPNVAAYSSLGFGSAHATGVNFAFCDGRVQTISFSIDPPVYNNLLSRCDGNVQENY
jgi:prepilin-type N-terminal cleavage/methylation domain-containing protein/prepilin-type processing-associated H-X9-DG protein